VVGLIAAFANNTQAQDNSVGILDEVIAIVGDNIILKSDLDKEYFQLRLQYPEYDGNLKCTLFDQLLTQKLLLHKADLDSIVIEDERLEYEINRRIEYYASQAGSVERLEKYLGIPIIQYKDEMRKKVRQQMLIQEAQASMLNNVKVSPTEVRTFYEEIPLDSMPDFNAEVEVAQLLVKPKPSKAADDYARNTADRLRAEIVSGDKDFCIAVDIYSDDVVSARDCGNLGDFKRGQMVPEFEAATFKLKKGEISPVIKSDFGYHIIQLIERKGEIANARHILIQPKILSSDLEKTMASLQKIKKMVEMDSITWCEAVRKYSEDENSKGSCGFYTDPEVGSAQVEITLLEADVALRIEKLKVGEISAPHSVPQADRSSAYRILYLKSENPPHKASLEKDYQKISVYALEKKKQDVLKTWSVSFRKDLYIWIDDKYFVCDGIDSWLN
jgi:peptidyl-prolyl cis-trans isomerase SurA